MDLDKTNKTIDSSQPKNRVSRTKISIVKYEKVEDLFGKIAGIERVLLFDRNITLLQVMEKIILTPEHKLFLVEPVIVHHKNSHSSIS